MNKAIKWPMLSISPEDNEIVKKIRRSPGALESIQDRDILMVAAALAVNLNIAPAPQKTTKGHDVMNGPTLSGAPLEDYRQHMLVMYWITKIKDDDLSEMSNTSAVVENFKDYAHRGLLYLNEVYLKPGGDQKLQEKFLSLMQAAK